VTETDMIETMTIAEEGVYVVVSIAIAAQEE
jgi:hypothetical protein